MSAISRAISTDAARAERRDKGLKEGALGLVSSTVVGVASTAPAYDSSAPDAVPFADDASCHLAGCGANFARNASAAEPVQCAVSSPRRPLAVSPKADENVRSWLADDRIAAGSPCTSSAGSEV